MTGALGRILQAVYTLLVGLSVGGVAAVILILFTRKL